MNRNSVLPVRGNRYTLREIAHVLELRDSPALVFQYRDVGTSIQNAHFTWEKLAEVHPKLMDSFWTYRYETSEWIPIFQFWPTPTFSQMDLERNLTIERDIDPFCDDPTRVQWWAVPKNLPREQYYKDPDARARLKESHGIDLDDPDWAVKTRDRWFELRTARTTKA